MRREVEVRDEADDDLDVEDEFRALYVLPATRAPIAAVFVRAPDKWWLVARWDLQTGELARGAWLRGNLYPRRTEISPDGEVLCYFLTKQSSRPFMGMTGFQTFSAVSKLPWVTALAAWREQGTWTRGHHFVPAGTWDIGDPQHGDATPLRARWGLAKTEPAQYANELRRGWVQHETCPPRAADDKWDEQRSVVLAKERSTSGARLVLVDQGLDFETPGSIEGRLPEYRLEASGRTEVLDEVVWADWHPAGMLLVATDDARLQIREVEGTKTTVLREHDLSEIEPAPGPSPEWAQRW